MALLAIRKTEPFVIAVAQSMRRVGPAANFSRESLPHQICRSCFLARLGYDSEPNLALLDVEDCFSRIPLGEDHLFLGKSHHLRTLASGQEFPLFERMWPQVFQGVALSFLFIPLMTLSNTRRSAPSMHGATSILNAFVRRGILGIMFLVMLPFIVLLRNAEAKPPTQAVPVAKEEVAESRAESQEEEPVLIHVSPAFVEKRPSSPSRSPFGPALDKPSSQCLKLRPIVNNG